MLHVLRDRITAEESLHLVSQLPLYIKAIYIDDGKYQKVPQKNLQEFLDEVRAQARLTKVRDFPNSESTQKEVEAVFKVLKNHISEEELKGVKAQLPKELIQLLEV